MITESRTAETPTALANTCMRQRNFTAEKVSAVAKLANFNVFSKWKINEHSSGTVLNYS